MTVFPWAIDSDSELPRIDDNLSEIGANAINSLRDSTFAIEAELGIHPAGSAGSVATRLDKSLTPDGDIKASALTSIGLVTLPITDSQVATNAGIKETKLALDYSTSNLHTLILTNQATLNSLAAFATITNADLLGHISGAEFLTDGSTPGRHVGSQLDLNAVPSDPRDPAYVWTGLVDKNGDLRTAATIADALLQINNDLVAHENAIANAHSATAITVDTDDFVEIPTDANTVQKALQALDDSDRLQIGDHRQTMHANGIPRHARSEQLTLDGYSQNIVPVTPVQAFLVKPPATTPVDSNTQGDDIIKFLPASNSGFIFDSYFAQVKVGDIVTIYYGIGVATSFMIESIRFIANSDWTIRINGTNTINTTDGYNPTARIDRPAFDINTYGVLAVASANNDIDASIMGSLVVGSPRGATALGLEFEPNEIDSTHYNLYLQLYPNGNPADYNILLPAIDISGNAGITPGQYTIDTIVAATNDGLRAAGYNYRFIAFSNGGEFGIMLADSVNNASFSIINGSVSGTGIITGAFLNNVVGDASTNGFDALGFGVNKAALASPQYLVTFASTDLASNFYTKLIVPLRRRNYVSNGVRRDTFAPTYLANVDGYWDGYISDRVVVGTTTVETSYTIDLDLSRAGLAIGKTIVIQPTVAFTDPAYFDADYGRFIIKSVSFVPSCHCDDNDLGKTVITVINGVHATANPIGFSSSPQLNVRLYFSEDSVGFNAVNIIDPSTTGIIYKRLHEVYISGTGNTFTHERARMPKQTETSTLLATTGNWSIKNVSPKLRGFFDTGSSALNKYVRFYVLSYNSVSGQYDGYIGARGNLFNVSKTGNITVGRKNIPSRFYDETNIDYVELEFFDNGASAGTDIMSTNVPRYVDIEIFPSLELDDENMLLATCELNGPIVEDVVDRRSFGNTSEVDFTQSAIEFITSGDRYLHENGVIKGMDFIGVSSVDSRILNFAGGIVLVNGNVLTINNESVAIPEIRLVGATLPATVTWAVCINETGQYEPIIITATKAQFFATTGTGSYYVPSVIWSELITRRKDLVVIALVTAVINSITLTVSDARRYVTNVGFHNEFVLVSGDEQYPGTFRSLTSVLGWVKNSSDSSYVIKVRGGDITLTAGDMLSLQNINGKTIIFDGLDSARAASTTATFILNQAITFAPNIIFKYITLKFIGVGATFQANTKFDSCALLGTSAFDVTFGNTTTIDNSVFLATTSGSCTFTSNISVKKSSFISGNSLSTVILDRVDDDDVRNIVFEDCQFTYTPFSTAPIFATGDKTNIVTNAGCIISGATNNTQSVRNFRVERCVFTNTLDIEQRPPDIGFIIKFGDVLDNIIIRDNQFIDTFSTSGQMNAIIVLNLNLGSASDGAIISNSQISNNYCNDEQSIILTTLGDAIDPTNINAPGLYSINNIINDNTCGNIGFVVSSDTDTVNTADLVPIANTAPGLTIENNVCRLIANLNSTGTYQFFIAPLGTITHNTGDVVIKGNSANWIHSICTARSYGSVRTGTILIDGNKLQAYNTDYLTEFGVVLSAVPLNRAIFVSTNIFADSFDETECRIVNNTTDFATGPDSVFGYANCFNVLGPNCIVSNNLFRGILDDPTFTTSILGWVESKFIQITDNRFERQLNKINSYITANRSRSDGYGMIVDNVFDSPTTNNGDPINVADLLLVVSATCPRIAVERNVNQSVFQFVNPSNGNFGINTAATPSRLVLAGNAAPGASISADFTAGVVVQFIYDVGAAAGLIIYKWIIATEDILPKNVKIIGASATMQSNAAVTIGQAEIQLATGATSATPIQGNVFNFSGAYVPNTPVISFFTVPTDTTYITGNDTFITVNVGIDNGSSALVSCASTYILYRW